MNSYIRIVATQCSLGTWFVSGIYVDTLHKGDTEDNNNECKSKGKVHHTTGNKGPEG